MNLQLVLGATILLMSSNGKCDEQRLSAPGAESLAIIEMGGKTWLVTGCARRGLIAPPAPSSVSLSCWQWGSGNQEFSPLRVENLKESGLSIQVKGKRAFSPLGVWTAHDAFFDGKGPGTWLYVTNSLKWPYTSSIEVFQVKIDAHGELELCWAGALYPWNDGHKPAMLRSSSSQGSAHDKKAPERPCGATRYLKQVNAVAVTPDGTVYASNSDYSLSAILRGSHGKLPCTMRGETAPTAKDTIVACRPGESEWRVVVRHVGGANGLALSNDGQTLVASAYHARRVLKFTRKPGSLELKLAPSQMEKDVLPYHPDNVTLAEDGRFWYAGQKSIGSILLHKLTFGHPPCKSGWAELATELDSVSERHGASPKGVMACSTALRVQDSVCFTGILSRRVVVVPIRHLGE